MKKLIYTASFLVLWLGIGNVKAQDMSAGTGDDPREEPGLGFKAGINSANLYDTKGDNFDYKAKVGLAAGAFLSLPFGKWVGFQPEVLYSQKGFKGSGSVLGSNYDYTRSTDYIDIPLQLQIKPAKELTLLVGPQYSFLIHKSFKFNSSLLTAGQESDVENNNVRKNTLGFVTGLDLNLNRFIISGRVAWDLQNNNGDGTSSSPRYRNVVLQLTLGVLL